MTKKSIFLLCILLVIFLTINTMNFSNISYNSKNKVSVENPKKSSESGGGYIMDTSASFSWIELVGNGGIELTDISNHDDEYQKLNITELGGWNFTFYETDYDCIYISSNGWISLFSEEEADGWADDIPSPSIENQDCVALFGDDLDMSPAPSGSGEAYYRLYGTTSGARYLVIEYYQVSYYGGQYLGTFEVIFYESGNIKFQYLNLQNIDDNYVIGLDHGDLVNYNMFDDWVEGQDITADAISFTYDDMDSFEYELGVSQNDEFTWVLTKVNNIKMELFYGSDWEDIFGVFSNPVNGYKTKINITSIDQNSTHWDINYTQWDWIYRFDDFSSANSGEESILYRREPLNYTSKHNLTNIFPYFIPKPTSIYLARANLSNFYDYIYYSTYSDETFLEIEQSKIINGDYIDVYGEAGYNSDGILEEVSLEYYNETSEREETIFELQQITPNLLSDFQIEFNSGENYVYYVHTVKHNYMNLCFGTGWENKFGFFPSMTAGEKTMINITSIVQNSTHWDINYTYWDWIPTNNNFDDSNNIEANLIYRRDPFSYTQMHNFTYIAPYFLPNSSYDYLTYANLDEEFYNDVDYYSSSGLTNLEFDLDPPGGADCDGDAYYDSNGILLTLEIEYDNGDEFTIFKISRLKPSISDDDDDDDDDDKEEIIPGYDLFLIISIVAFISISLIMKNKKLN